MLAVVLQGGLVQSIVSDDPKCPVREITVIDYDTEGANAMELRENAQMVPQDTGTEAVAYVQVREVGKALIDLKGIHPVTDEDLEGMGFGVKSA